MKTLATRSTPVRAPAGQVPPAVAAEVGDLRRRVADAMAPRRRLPPRRCACGALVARTLAMRVKCERCGRLWTSDGRLVSR
jgi:hypothetical protein